METIDSRSSNLSNLADSASSSCLQSIKPIPPHGSGFGDIHISGHASVHVGDHYASTTIVENSGKVERSMAHLAFPTMHD